MRSRSCLAFLFICGSSGAWAQAPAASEIAAIRAEIGRLAERLERLEQAPAGALDAPPPALAVEQSVAPAEPALRFSGDLRYRHEAINEEGVGERQRQRIRARFGVTADVTEDLRVGLVLATGDDDPVSGNQTLDGGFDRKTFGVDRAFFTWQATEALSVSGGKMANPFFRPGGHHLIYDSDLNPEGLALRYNFGQWFTNVAGLWVEERGAADDSILLGGQFGYRGMLDSGARLTAGLSYYDYLETQGQTPFYDGTGNGNRLDLAGDYLRDFNELELFAELALTVAERPLTVFADLVNNTEADGADTGFALGASFGEVSRPGTWRVGYLYQDLEADAVIATFTDSDFAGGGTDGRGHVFEFSYGLRERWTLGLRYFLNERGADAGNEHDYNRLQADVSFAY
ncbi:MAG TPA: putative porin [Gammaproteobacteria bacterium]|nr:putative porin [Gammaproteobacteria bacterium]